MLNNGWPVDFICWQSLSLCHLHAVGFHWRSCKLGRLLSRSVQKFPFLLFREGKTSAKQGSVVINGCHGYLICSLIIPEENLKRTPCQWIWTWDLGLSLYHCVSKKLMDIVFMNSNACCWKRISTVSLLSSIPIDILTEKKAQSFKLCLKRIQLRNINKFILLP